MSGPQISAGYCTVVLSAFIDLTRPILRYVSFPPGAQFSLLLLLHLHLSPFPSFSISIPISISISIPISISLPNLYSLPPTSPSHSPFYLSSDSITLVISIFLPILSLSPSASSSPSPSPSRIYLLHISFAISISFPVSISFRISISCPSSSPSLISIRFLQLLMSYPSLFPSPSAFY
jgi:hypothetical protein